MPGCPGETDDERTDPLAPITAEIPSPQRVGRFILLTRLGEGGMGVVYLAHDQANDRKVAIKLIRPGLLGAGARLASEASAMGKVVHPNVVTVYEAGSSDGEVYIAMELVAGGTLRDWLKAEARPTDEILERFILAGRGLAAVHAAGLIHRDFKPGNVLLGDDGRPRVTDFGLAGLSAAEGEEIAAGGAIAGTPRYMAPEQLLGCPVDPRADQFAFAVALHEALAGRLPFAGNTPAEIKENVLAGRVGPPPRPVPHHVADAMARALRPNPEDRWPTMHALLAILGRPPFVVLARVLADRPSQNWDQESRFRPLHAR